MLTYSRIVLAAGVAATLAVGCSSSSKKADGNTSPGGTSSTNCGGTGMACLTGVVTTADTVDSSYPSGIGDAAVSLADGTFLGTTNDQGWYFVRNVPAGQSVQVCYEATSFARRCRTITAAGGQNVQVSNTGLLDRNPLSGNVDPVLGGTITWDSATSIYFPPNSACEATGAAATGTVRCSLSPIVAYDQVQRDAAPGNFRGQQTGGAVSQLVTGGMMEIVCKDGGGTGAKVNVCSGQTVTVRFPVDAGTCTNEALHPATMASWGFNETTGLWVQYGTFTKTCGTASYYEGAVNHFSYWNADNPIQTSCASGKVLDSAGAPVLGALVRCDGDAAQTDGYQGPSEAYSAADGTFCVAVRRNSSFKCIARKGAFVSAPIAAHSGDNQNTCGGPGCTAIGNFSLTDPLARIVLTWGQYPYDLDSHTYATDGSGPHVYYGSRGSLAAAPYIELDTDDTSSFGPEITSFVHGVAAKRYRFCVHNFNGYQAGPPMFSIPTSGAVVDAFLGGDHLRFTPPAAASQSNWWRILDFTMDANGNASQITGINQLADTCL